MDENERAHMDYNRGKRYDHIYLQCIGFRKGQGILRNHPYDLYRSRYALVTISNQDNAYIIEQMVRYLESHGELSIYKLLFAGLEMISNAYYPIIDRLDKHKDELNRLLRKTTTTKNLYALSDLETGMVYLVAAISKIGCC